MISDESPKYLYKILSHKHWQESQARKAIVLSAEDAQFIHFSKEDQLTRIISKYWGDASKFAVLKIGTALLQGNLVYEANPGGTTKYYHLYDGFIPFAAVLEARELG